MEPAAGGGVGRGRGRGVRAAAREVVEGQGIGYVVGHKAEELVVVEDGADNALAGAEVWEVVKEELVGGRWGGGGGG